MKKRDLSLVRNALSNWGALIVNTAVAFFLTPFIVRSIGKSGYGVWSVIVSLIGYYGLLDAGISSAVTRYVARFSAQDDRTALRETASTAVILLTALGVLISLLALAVASPLAGFISLPEGRRDDFIVLVKVIGVATGLSFPAKAYRSILLAYERFVPNNVLRTSVTLVRTALTIWALDAGYGLTGIGYVYLAVHALELAAYLLLVHFTAPEARVGFRAASRESLRALFGFGIISFVITVSDQLRFNLDSVVIAKMIDVQSVAVYRIAALIVRNVLNLLVAAMGVLTPRFARLEGKGTERELKSLFLTSLSVSSFLSFGAAMMSFAFGGKFIQLWMGEEFYGAVPVLWILVTGYAFALAQSPAIGVLYAKNSHRFYAWVTAGEAAANVVLSVALAPRFGIVGVALGTTVPMLVVKLLVQPFYMSRVIGIKLSSYLLRMLLPGVLAALVTAAVWRLGLVAEWEKFSVAASIATAFAAGAVFSGVVLSVFMKRRMLGIR